MGRWRKAGTRYEIYRIEIAQENEGMAEIASALLRQVEAEALAGGITDLALDTRAANGSARSLKLVASPRSI